MVFGVLQRKARKAFIFIDLLRQRSSPSQSEKIKRIMEEKGNLDLISFQRWLVCWCREPFLVRGRLAVKWFFSPFSLICLLYSHGEQGASTCLPGVLLQRKQLNGLTNQQQGAGLFFFSETHLLNVPFGKRLSTFNFPRNCVRNSCRHELLRRWSEVVLVLGRVGKGGRLQTWAASLWHLPWTPLSLANSIHSHGSGWDVHSIPPLPQHHSSLWQIPSA